MDFAFYLLFFDVWLQSRIYVTHIFPHSNQCVNKTGGSQTPNTTFFHPKTTATMKLSTAVNSLASYLILGSIAVSPSCNAFVINRHGAVSSRSHQLSALPTPEESAKALSDYMAKAHEEKLRAVKEAEAKRDAEVQVCGSF